MSEDPYLTEFVSWHADHFRFFSFFPDRSCRCLRRGYPIAGLTTAQQRRSLGIFLIDVAAATGADIQTVAMSAGLATPQMGSMDGRSNPGRITSGSLLFAPPRLNVVIWRCGGRQLEVRMISPAHGFDSFFQHFS